MNGFTNGDGRYSWFGDASGVTGGVIKFVGDPAEFTGSIGLTWTILQRASDGSQPQLNYSTDGGNTVTSTALGSEGTPQKTINESGLIAIPLAGLSSLQFGCTSTGGAATAGATPWVVSVAITRNVNETLQWDSPNPFNGKYFNANPNDIFDQASDTLLHLRQRILIRLGFANQATNPPPGMAPLVNDFLFDAQSYLWRKYQALQTKRFFRWKIIPGQHFYSLQDNDEDISGGFHLDVLKTIDWAGVQDTRNVWYPMIKGIPPQLYTMSTKPWRPARYDIRQAIEIYPMPDQTYFLWLRGHVQLRSFVNDSDTSTIDSNLLFLHALANAKNHYQQPDAKDIEAQANDYRGQLIAATHGTNSYIPGTMAVPPAVRPTLIQYQDNQQA